MSGTAIVPDLSNRMWKGKFKPDTNRVWKVLENIMAQGFLSVQIGNKSPITLEMPTFDEKLNPSGSGEVDYNVALRVVDAAWNDVPVKITRAKAKYDEGLYKYHLDDVKKEQEQKRREADAEVEQAKSNDSKKTSRPKKGLPADMRDLPVLSMAGPTSQFEMEILESLWKPVLEKYHYKGNLTAISLPEVVSGVAPREGLFGQIYGSEIRKSPKGYVVINNGYPLEFKTLVEAETFHAWCRRLQAQRARSGLTAGIDSMFGGKTALPIDENAIMAIYLGKESGAPDKPDMDTLKEKYGSDIRAAIAQMKKEEGISEVKLASRIPYKPKIARVKDRAKAGKRRKAKR